MALGPAVPIRDASSLALCTARARGSGSSSVVARAALSRISAPSLRSSRSSAAWLGCDTMAARRWPLVVRSLRLCASSSANRLRTSKSGSEWGVLIRGLVRRFSRERRSGQVSWRPRGAQPLTGQFTTLTKGGVRAKNSELNGFRDTLSGSRVRNTPPYEGRHLPC